MLNRNIHTQSTPKHLQKKDLLFMVGFASINLIFNVFLNNAETISTIIASSTIAFIVIFYLIRTLKKTLSEQDIRINIGIVGLCGSIISNLLVAVHNKTTIFEIVMFFVLITVVILGVSAVLILLVNKISKKSKRKEKNIDITPFALIGSLVGITGSRYLRTIGIEISIDILICLLNFILSWISIAQLIKSRLVRKT